MHVVFSFPICPTVDDTWQTESTASAPVAVSDGFQGAKWALLGQNCLSPQQLL